MTVNPKTTMAGVVAGLAILGDALAQPGPWTFTRGLRVALAVAIAALGVWARDHDRASQLPPAPSPARSDPPPGGAS